MTKKCEKENWKKKTAHLLKYGLNRASTDPIYKHNQQKTKSKNPPQNVNKKDTFSCALIKSSLVA